MIDFAAAPRRLLARLQNAADLALALLHNRLELLGNDLQLEVRRIFDALLRGALGLLLLACGIFFAGALVVAVFWDTHRLLALGGVAAVLLLAGAALVADARRRLQPPGGPLAATLAELARDRDALAQARSASAPAPETPHAP